MRLRALALACVAGWVGIAAFFSLTVAPLVFRTIDRAAAGRRPDELRRSVEVDAILVGSDPERQAWTRRFCAERRVTAGHAVLDTALVGDAEEVAGRLVEYADAGATDLMLGFADFPATGMLERFARDVLPRVGRATGAAAQP